MTDHKPSHDNKLWLRAIVQQFEGPLIQYATVLLGDHDRARDVTQDTFLRLCRQDRADVENNIRRWLFTVCRNRAFDVCKKEKRMKVLSEDKIATRASSSDEQSSAMEKQEMYGQIIAMLNALPNNQREVIQLRLQSGLSYRDISGVTGLTVSNVGYLIHQGIKTIREQMACQTPT